MRVLLSCVVGLTYLYAPIEAHCGEPPSFELRDGDRVVFVGDTFIERDQKYGYLESVLSINNPDKNLVFRNLGWSGDTVGGISRSGFDPPEAGFAQLRQQILAVKPTVVIVGYGMADSFAGQAGLPAFEEGLSRLLNVIDSTKARVVFLSPLPHAKLSLPLPDPNTHNRDLARYRDVIERFASQRRSPFVDLFDILNLAYSTSAMRQPATGTPLTNDGIHLTELGYRAAAVLVGDELGQDRAAGSGSLTIKQDGKIRTPEFTTAFHVEIKDGGLKFEVIDAFLPALATGVPGLRMQDSAFSRRVVVDDLAPGEYSLKVDGKTVAIHGAGDWKKGINLQGGPEFEQVEALRAAINRKNELFFYRWRPQNITYLLGFRKHEQGNNAVEIPRFDPLVAEQEKIIGRLKKPIAHVYELSRVEKEVGR